MIYNNIIYEIIYEIVCIMYDIIYDILYDIIHLPNASILDAPMTVQELSTRLLDTSTDLCRASDRIQLVCPFQLILRTFAGGALHCVAERCRSDIMDKFIGYVYDIIGNTQ